VHRENREVLRIPLAVGTTTFGRQPDRDYQLLDPEVSRHQFDVILRPDGTCALRVPEAAAPVLLGGEPVSERTLARGDEITAGGTVLWFDAPAEVPTSVEFTPAAAPTSATRKLAGETARVLGLLAELGGSLRHINDPRTLRRKLVTVTRKQLPVTRVMLALIPEGTTRLEPECWDFDPQDPTGDRFELSAGLLQRILDEDSVSVFEEAVDAAPGASVEAAAIQSALGVALREEGEIRGVLYADNRLDGAVFSKTDRAFFEIIAGFVAATLARHRPEEPPSPTETEEEIGATDDRLVGRAPCMLALAERARRFARLRAPILLTGERGTGKGVTARFVHRHSTRTEGPFIHVNCASIPETMAEAEFFGIAPGSGVSMAPKEGRDGYFQAATGGTLFLDEVGDLPAAIQPKLLVVLREGEVTPVGASRPIPVDVRIIAATNLDLTAMSKEDRFRNDLIDRLAAFTLRCPPLRERAEDIAGLARYLLARILAQEGIDPDKLLSDEALANLSSRRWEGNVAELENVLREAAALTDGEVIGVDDLPGAEEGGAGIDLHQLRTLAQVERDHVAGVLKRLHWHKAKTAEVLGVSRGTLDEKIRKYELTPPPGMEVKPGRKPKRKR
jgi:DNA-binding NtrC family response regulator